MIKKEANRLFFLSNNNLLLEHVAVVVVQMDDVDAAADAADRKGCLTADEDG